jgi:hypothetical protein
MVDPSTMKLGKMARVFDPRVRAIAPISHTWPPAPASIDWTIKANPNYGLMLNDRLGDCTAAAPGHAIQTWTSLTRPNEVTVSDDDILKFYEGSTGYNPADPNTDQGGIMTKVLAYWMKNPIAGNVLSAVASVAPGSRTDVKTSIWLFGGCNIGVQLPISAQRQDVWDVPPGGPKGSGEPGTWGGHDVWVPAYDEQGLTCITWGAKKRMSWAFWDTYVDEAYALLSPDWLAANDLAPPNFKMQELLNYLNEFR